MKHALIALAAWASLAHASSITVESFLLEAHALARLPATPEAMKRRGGLVAWLVTSPIAPKRTWCNGLLVDPAAQDQDLQEQLVVQGMLSSTAHARTSPEPAPKRASLKAGLIAALSVYDASIAQRHVPRNAFYDDLLATRDDASLDRYIDSAGCD